MRGRKASFRIPELGSGRVCGHRPALARRLCTAVRLTKASLPWRDDIGK